MSSVICSAFRDRTRKSSSTQDPTLARLSLNTTMTARQEPLDATLSAGDNVLSRLSFSKGYLHGLSSHFNRYQLIKAAVDVSTNDVVVPVRAVGRRTYKSNILALETWLSENLASVSTERVSPEAQRDLEVTIYCAIAAGIAAQRPSLFNVMSQVVDVLSHVSIGEADQLAANPLLETQVDVKNLAARLVELNDEISRYVTSIETWEKRLANRIQEFDLLTAEILGLKSHISNLKSLIIAGE